MENQKSQSRVDLLIAAVVFVIVLIMIFMKAGEVKKENSMGPRNGQTTTSSSN